MRVAFRIALGAALLAACSEPAASPQRAELRTAGGKISVVPSSGQLPFCLVMEVRRAIARPIVSGEEGQSVPCSAGKPIGGDLAPTQKDPYRLYVVFSDKPLKADTVALQINDRLGEGPGAQVTAMDLRAPGQVTLQALDVRPAEIH